MIGGFETKRWLLIECDERRNVTEDLLGFRGIIYYDVF